MVLGGEIFIGLSHQLGHDHFPPDEIVLGILTVLPLLSMLQSVIFPSSLSLPDAHHKPLGQRVLRRAIHATRVHVKLIKAVSRVSTAIAAAKISPEKK